MPREFALEVVDNPRSVCLSDRLERACALALLVAADAVFLWMFLSTGPLEDLAVRTNGPGEPATLAAFRYAAEWRHGMAGNAWVYMPGFFATSAALWLHARLAAPRRIHTERISAATAAFGMAFALALPTSADVVQRFTDVSGVRFTHAIRVPSFACAFAGAYTLLTWSAFVLACRQALLRRTARPFVGVTVLTLGLAALRPSTVDAFVSHWAAGAASGDVTALLSCALVFVFGGLLYASERPLPHPQPGEMLLPGGGSARGQHEEAVRGRRDHVEAG